MPFVSKILVMTINPGFGGQSFLHSQLPKIRAIREISHDMTGRRKVRLSNGREASALDIQREYHARAVEHVARRGSDPVTDREVGHAVADGRNDTHRFVAEQDTRVI